MAAPMPLRPPWEIMWHARGKEMAMTQSSRAHVGDLVVVHGHRLGESSRTGEILEVLGVPEHEHYRVQWDDGHESVFIPGSDAVIRHVEQSHDEPVLTHDP